MPAIRNVLIVGAGISGLTAGNALCRAGIAVHIAEVRTDVSQQVGVGLSLQGNCIAALDRLGLAAPCLEAGVPSNHIHIRRPDGELIARQPVLQTGGAAYPGTAGISRKALHEILLQGATDVGANIRFGTTFKSVVSQPDGVQVEFTDGSRGNYDFLIGADGIGSKVRSLLFPHVCPTFCGQAIWRADVPRPNGNLTTELYLGGPYGVVGICPISPAAAYLYLLEAAQETPSSRSVVTAVQLREKLQRYGGSILTEAVLSLQDSKSVSVRGIDQLLVPDQWHRGRMVIIGDAAHANPPVLAQGAAMGIEDAVVLAEELALESPSTENLESALLRFTRRRMPRASLVVRNSVQLSEWQVNHNATPQDLARVMHETQSALSRPL